MTKVCNACGQEKPLSNFYGYTDPRAGQQKWKGIYWRPHHKVYPELAPEQDFLAFDEEGEVDVGRVYLMIHSGQDGRWFWTMYAHSNTRRVPFDIHGHEGSRGAAGRRVVEAYRLFLGRSQKFATDPSDHNCSSRYLKISL